MEKDELLKTVELLQKERDELLEQKETLQKDLQQEQESIRSIRKEAQVRTERTPARNVHTQHTHGCSFLSNR